MRPFKSVQNERPRRSVFDLSYSKLQDANMGLLYPVLCEEMVPGDFFKIGNEVVVRAMPLVAPLLHEIYIYTHYFFVPNRILWDGWEDFISGGFDGQDASVLPRMPYPDTQLPIDFKDSLWNYLGFPFFSNSVNPAATTTLPVDFPRRAYSAVWNEYYRDETLQTEIDIENAPSNVLLRRNWSKDYFTSALPWAQRGTAPSLPITGNAPLSGNPAFTSAVSFAGFPANVPVGLDHDAKLTYLAAGGGGVGFLNANQAAAESQWQAAITGTVDNTGITADLSSATTFDVNDLRLVFQIQKWMERNARSGVRYTEFLRSHFGVAPRDERLQRPEYIGGSKAPVIISEVLQTSETATTPQGNLAGHGISVQHQYCGKYYAQEFGVIIGIMSIMPVPMYCQGINRQWTKRTKYDYYFPEFSTLGEQAIEMQEIYFRNTDNENKAEFGFQGRYDEMRYKPNMAVGELRPGFTFDYWTLCRQFGSVPAINSSFITCNPDPRAWAVQSGAPQFVVHFGNRIKAVRPIPSMGTPGLIDHH